MKGRTIDLLVRRHGVRAGNGIPFSATVAGADVTLTDFQIRLLSESAPIRIASAPTGAGKTFAFELAPFIGKNVLLVVPTRRLAQNLEQAVYAVMRRNGWDEAEIGRRLAVWTSDAMADAKESGLTTAEVRTERVRQLRGLDGFHVEGSFIIATPESLGHLLLNPPRHESGQPSISLRDLLSRDHIVFDEFHMIEARGFGLACALCRVAAGLSTTGHRPHITFLSATPIRISDTLTAFDIPESEICVFEEHVESWRPDEDPSGARIVHGDVEVSLGHYTDLLDAVAGETDAIVRTLRSGQAVVVIFDSVAELKGARNDLSEVFRTHGVAKDDILTINSIDDAHQAFHDAYGVGGRTADPKQARVILATSSIEIGVTFSASLLIMDPGHDLCSFIQRVGRVSRGDLPGRVVVTGSVPGNMLTAFRKPDVSGAVGKERIEIDVGTFIGAILRNVACEFKGRMDQSEEGLQTYGMMSNRAVWCACLFWTALYRVWSNHRGERDTLRNFRPDKVRCFEAMFSIFKHSGLDRPKIWLCAFIREASRFRNIEPRLRVHHGDRTDWVPESLVGRYPDLSRAPAFEDSEGFYLELKRPLESILKTGDTRPFRPTLQPLAPLDGMSLPAVPRHSAGYAFVQELKRSRRHPFGKEGDKVCETVIRLVSMTGVVPQEDDDEASGAYQGSVVV